MAHSGKMDTLAHFTVTELPLTGDDIRKMNKDLATSFKVNLLLIPILIIIYFWGLLYFAIFAVFVIVCNMVFIKNYSEIKQELQRPKLVLTGVVTGVNKNEGTILYFGPDSFDITYANTSSLIAVGDTICLHYSKKANHERSRLIDLEKVAPAT